MSSSTQARSKGDSLSHETPSSQQPKNLVLSNLANGQTTLATTTVQSIVSNVVSLPQINSLGSIIGLLLSPSLGAVATPSSEFFLYSTLFFCIFGSLFILS